MDNTELHYLTYDPDAIWEEMMLAYIAAGGDALYGGDEKEILLRGVLASIVQVFAGVDNALRMQTLRYAVGDYLDILGELRECARIEATAATATVQISFRQTGETGTLPAGSNMTADGLNFYATTEDIAKTGYAQTVTVSVVATRAGAEGNALLAGSDMFLTVTDDSVSEIKCIASASGGNITEDDETYRERIRTYGLASVTTGPATQYESVSMSVSSEIIDAHAINAGAGVVAVYLLLSSDTGADAILAAVYKALSPDDIRPLTDSVRVYRAANVPYTLNVKYNPATTTSTQIATAIEDYQSWQDHKIGRAFNPDRLLANLYSVGCSRVLFGDGSSFNGGDVTYTEIAENEVCKGTITLEAISG